jgi:hypothetical protein
MGWQVGSSATIPGPMMDQQKPVAGIPSVPIGVSSQPPSFGGFGWDKSKLNFERLDPYFPKDLLKLTIKQSGIDSALDRMVECFQNNSIQVEFEHNPVGAKLRTLERIELFLIFFEYDNGDLAVDIQRRQGDYLDANRCIHKILEAAKGTPSTQPQEQERSAKRIREFESFLDRCAAAPSQGGGGNVASPWATPPTPEESMKSTLNSIHASLTSNRLDQRKVGLDNLRIFTDLDKTLSQTAVATALVVIAGTAPASGYEKKCQEIRDVIARVVMKQEFADDDTNMYADMDTDIVAFMSSDNAGRNTSGRSRYYDQYMSEMHHLVLNILANSLEVLQVFDGTNTAYEMGVAVADLNLTCASFSDQHNSGIVEALMELVGHADQRLPDAYLACKALRHLLKANQDLRSVFKGGSYSKSVQKAKSAGSHNAKLLAEAEKLEAFL